MVDKSIPKISRELSQEFLTFVNKCHSPFHVCQNAKELLLQNQFTELSESENWKLEKGGKYFFTRNQSSLLAFTVGHQFDPNNTGFKIVGAHTDSPCIRLAPLSKLKQAGQIQTHVTKYGGGLFNTWFDRDLTLAGKVIYKNDKGELESTLFDYDKPLLKVPHIAIHLQTAEERQAFKFNAETHLKPVFANEVYNQLSGTDYSQFEKEEGFQSQHYGGLLNLISKTIQVPVENLVDFDLYFADTQPSQLFGLNEEFISSPRLDNLYSSFFSLTGLLEKESIQETSSFINVVTLFDHEEIGSESFQGAQSIFLKSTLDRIFHLLSQNQSVSPDSLQRAYLKSFLLSADMAHGVHPNYQEKHKSGYQIQMNKGVVIKTNHNQSYITDAVSASIFKQICEQVNVPTQNFIVKNDQGCGSTIGPGLSSLTGIKGVDIGISQLGMHSIRETCGIIDSYYYKQMFVGFFKNFDKTTHKLLKH